MNTRLESYIPHVAHHKGIDSDDAIFWTQSVSHRCPEDRGIWGRQPMELASSAVERPITNLPKHLRSICVFQFHVKRAANRTAPTTLDSCISRYTPIHHNSATAKTANCRQLSQGSTRLPANMARIPGHDQRCHDHRRGSTPRTSQSYQPSAT